MNWGIVQKAAIEIWPATLLCGALVCAAEAALAYVIPTFQAQFSESLMQIKFLQNLIGAMLGVKVAGQLGPELFMAFPWVHPVVLALLWAHALVCCTRTPAGEVDRGTADMSFTLPVTRWGILRAETAVWIVAGLIVLALALVGSELGGQFVEAGPRPQFGRTLVALGNLFCLYLAVGGLSWLVSAASDRRGTALTVVFVVLLASFLLNFLAQFWEFADRFAFLGILHYYRPLFILRDGSVPWGDMGTLLTAAAVLWIAAGVTFRRRDVCTV
jgi:ABC-type transport system involved in multi-copper enzyme maturation permease subunit